MVMAEIDPNGWVWVRVSINACSQVESRTGYKYYQPISHCHSLKSGHLALRKTARHLWLILGYKWMIR